MIVLGNLRGDAFHTLSQFGVSPLLFDILVKINRHIVIKEDIITHLKEPLFILIFWQQLLKEMPSEGFCDGVSSFSFFGREQLGFSGVVFATFIITILRFFCQLLR